MDIFGELFAGLAGDEYTPAQLRAMRLAETRANAINSAGAGASDIAQEQAARQRKQAATNHFDDAPAQRLPPEEADTIDINYEDVSDK